MLQEIFSFMRPAALHLLHTVLATPITPQPPSPRKRTGLARKKNRIVYLASPFLFKTILCAAVPAKIFLHQQRERVQELEKERETKRKVGGGGGEEIEQLECETFSLPCAGKGCCSCGSAAVVQHFS